VGVRGANVAASSGAVPRGIVRRRREETKKKGKEDNA